MTQTSSNQSKKPSKKAQRSSARLYAVQGVYQMLANDQSAGSVLEEILYKRIYEPVEDETIVMPDGALLTAVINGVAERREELSEIVLSNYHKNLASLKDDNAQPEAPEGLVFSVLLCGTYELLSQEDVDPPIIISDYINVGHAFFDRGETKLINGVLDKISKSLR